MTNESEKMRLRDFLSHMREEERLNLLLAEIEGRVREPSDELVLRTSTRIHEAIREFDAAASHPARLDKPGTRGHETEELSSVAEVRGGQTENGDFDPDVVYPPNRQKVKQGWTPVTAVVELNQRLAASSHFGRQGWVPVDAIDDVGRAVRLRALLRDDGSVRLLRVDSGDRIVGVFNATGEMVGELTKKNDEALVFLGIERHAASDLVAHLQLKFRDV
ncbi:hypothetical protein [Prosthecodimorpha hirschii]|uniref:hypothetical protein n=1 Tax=Prosthecodimorpha hirschii TaxID=665126 RepID=UPI001125BB0C|nr:hypothetical protein [Prosthecomicrobium hirschii]